MKAKKPPTPNDQKSTVKNPTSPLHQKAIDNRSVQIQKTKAVKK